MRPITPLTVSATLLLTCAGCGPSSSAQRSSTPAQPAAPTQTSAPAAPASTAPASPSSALTVTPAEWRAGTAGSEARLALLVAADRYVEPSWAITAATNNLTAMRDALQASCGIAGQAVAELSGNQVNRDAVRAGLAQLGRQIQGRQGVMLIYWTGHGFIDQQGEARWFTHYTRELAAGGYDNTISRAELGAWIAEACGPGVTPVVVADVCRIRTNAPPPPATLTPLALWDLQATKAGRYSEAPPPDQASPFTRAFVASLGSLSQAGEGGLEQVFAETHRRCLELTGGRQEPELIKPTAPLPDPGLVRSQRLSFAVEAVDALGGRMIPGVTVRLDARPAGTAADGPQRQEAAPGRHVVRISAPGYCARVEEIELGAERSGGTLRLALLPQLVRLTGRIEPAGVHGVRIRGLDATVRDGFHRVQTTSSPDGSFELRLPVVSEGIEVIITRGEQIVGRGSVPATLDRYRLVSENGIEGIRDTDLGAIRVGGGGGDAVAAAAAGLAQVGAIPMPTALTNLPRGTPAGLDGAMDKNRWDQAMRMADAKRWSIAYDQLQQIVGRLPEDVAARWSAYLLAEQARTGDLPAAWKLLPTASIGLPRQAVAAVIAARAWDATPDPAQYPDLAALEAQLDTPARPVAQARRIATAAGRIPVDLQRDPAALLAWLHPCSGPAWSDTGWTAARRQGATDALVALLHQAVERGIATDAWDLAEQVQQWAARFPEAASVKPVVAALERLAHERQPLAARRAFLAAQEAFAGGDAQAAYTQYRAALDAKANDHYRRLIEPQVEYLRQQLFIRHFNTGLEHELEGRLSQALLSYTAARDFDAGVRADVERLQQAGVDIASYRQRWEQEDERYAKAEHERQAAWAAARQSDTSQAYDVFLRNNPMAPESKQAQRLQLAARQRETADSAASMAFADGRKHVLDAFASQYPQHARAVEARRRAALTPAWASEVGQDATGMWAKLSVGGQVQMLRLIPAGTFQMGRANGHDDEKPVHSVEITQPFWLADSECTQGLWKAVMGESLPIETGRTDFPVTEVSWDDCQAFLLRLNGQVAGLRACLPTEAQWEYASCAGKDSNSTSDFGVTSRHDEFNHFRRSPVKQKHANAWGLYDMHGNAREWCFDWYGPYPAVLQRDPSGPPTGIYRANRGSCNGSKYCSLAERGRTSPDFRSNDPNNSNGFGFRFAVTVTALLAGPSP